MTILGIDPGLATTGYGIIDIDKKEYKLKGFGTIETKKDSLFLDRLSFIYNKTIKIIKDYEPCCVAIEELFFSKNTKTAIAVSHARGVLMLACAHSEKSVFEYKPLEIKLAVTGYGKADKTQVTTMVQYLLKVSCPIKPDDASDALAIAICHANRLLSSY